MKYVNVSSSLNTQIICPLKNSPTESTILKFGLKLELRFKMNYLKSSAYSWGWFTEVWSHQGRYNYALRPRGIFLIVDFFNFCLALPKLLFSLAIPQRQNCFKGENCWLENRLGAKRQLNSKLSETDRRTAQQVGPALNSCIKIWGYSVCCIIDHS